MKPFHTIAIPHEDIVKNRLEMDVFAADLWDTYKNRGSTEYTDEKTFFKKTHITKSLQNVLDDVQNRVQGKGGDRFQHIETPFGGGKTHAMIAMYHSARSWGAKPVVIVGTSMGKDDTIWGMIEKQLDGKVDVLSGMLAPGREKIRDVLERHGPVIILIDELLQYVAVAAGVKIEDTNLATQVVIFIQQLTEAISTLDHVCVVASFPASTLEIADREKAEELLMKLRNVSGRKDRKITPVSPDDVPNIIRSRLFSVTESDIVRDAEDTISRFVEYCEKESILPPKMTANEYRKKFEHTYPFLPDVIDTLYHNWGSFASFQRTRGVLRLLSMVIHSLKDSERPYITLADFDLNNNEIRRELLVHIGDKFDSVLTKDITGGDSGATRVDKELGQAYRGLRLGSRTATSIFMHSFSSDGKKGVTMNQIKVAASHIDSSSSIVSDVVDNFRSKLSYFKTTEGRHLFSSEPNINRLKLDKMDNIKDIEVEEVEKILLKSNLGVSTLSSHIWTSSRDVGDSPQLKLVILRNDDEHKCKDMLDNKGDMPRIYRNSIFFLCAPDSERIEFTSHVKNKLALEGLLRDLNNPEQKKQVVDELRKVDSMMGINIKKCYRTLYVPSNDGLQKYDMGVPTMGMSDGISNTVLKLLVAEQQVHEKIGPLVLKKYIGNDKFARTTPMYELLLKTRGERRPTSRDVIERAISDGVEQGIFGLGELIGGKPSCMSFQTSVSVSFAENEIIIDAVLCTKPEEPRPEPESEPTPKPYNGGDEPDDPNQESPAREYISLKLDIPEGRLSDTWGIVRLLNEKFRSIHLSVNAKDGSVSENELNQIRETLRQLGADSDI